MKALTFDHFGGPEVLRYQEIPNPEPAPGEVLVEVRAVGLNFADVYRRRGNYHLDGEPPYILGYEGAGRVVEGSEEGAFRVGDRVGFADVPFANAELVAAPADRLVRLPEAISFDVAASILLQGLTAQYLARDSYSVQDGDVALVHASAGGVGQLLSQIVKIQGAGVKVLGLTSSAKKRQAALAAGADEVFLYREPWQDRVRESTQGGVDVVYDSVGSTLQDSFAVTCTGGTVVFYGMAGGDPEPVDPRMLMDTSKTLTGGDLWNVLTSSEERQRRSGELFGWIAAGDLKLAEPTRFPLADGADAHCLLESRKSVGKILLIP